MLINDLLYAGPRYTAVPPVTAAWQGEHVVSNNCLSLLLSGLCVCLHCQLAEDPREDGQSALVGAHPYLAEKVADAAVQQHLLPLPQHLQGYTHILKQQTEGQGRFDFVLCYENGSRLLLEVKNAVCADFPAGKVPAARGKVGITLHPGHNKDLCLHVLCIQLWGSVWVLPEVAATCTGTVMLVVVCLALSCSPLAGRQCSLCPKHTPYSSGQQRSSTHQASAAPQQCAVIYVWDVVYVCPVLLAQHSWPDPSMSPCRQGCTHPLLSHMCALHCSLLAAARDP